MNNEEETEEELEIFDILSFLGEKSTTGDVLDYKIFNPDYTKASFAPPVSDENEAVGPYKDEDDEISFFGKEGDDPDEYGVSSNSNPKINSDYKESYANKKDRYNKIKKINRALKNVYR